MTTDNTNRVTSTPVETSLCDGLINVDSLAMSVNITYKSKKKQKKNLRLWSVDKNAEYDGSVKHNYFG